MNHAHKCESGCPNPAVWRSGHFYFCHACHEEIIEAKGFEAYPWERLSENEEDFIAEPWSIRQRPKGRATQRRTHKATDRELAQADSAVRRIPDSSNSRGYREVCVTLAAWERRREDVYDRDGGRCRRCGDEAPLHARTLPPLEPGLLPVVQRAGEAMHIAARKMGGGFRDDHPDNLVWGCSDCHRLDPTCKFLQREAEANQMERGNYANA